MAKRSQYKYASRQVRRSSRALVRAIANCSDCEWTSEEYKSSFAARRATQHVRTYGHKVSVEQWIVYTVGVKL